MTVVQANTLEEGLFIHEVSENKSLLIDILLEKWGSYHCADANDMVQGHQMLVACHIREWEPYTLAREPLYIRG